MSTDSGRISTEALRVLEENARRDREVDPDRYAPWNATEAFMVEGRRRVAVDLLKHHGVFPKRGDACLEIGYGRGGWLPDLLEWGLGSGDLHGIELDKDRAEVAWKTLSGADLRVGNAAAMPWPDAAFRLVIASTVFTSILDSEVRSAIADEVTRVLAPGGALLWYDFRMNNPSNPHVRRVVRSELRSLFPGLSGSLRALTLAPPVARTVVPVSRSLARLLESVPFLRTHLLAVLVKSDA